jgi:hypothetical protein
MVGAGEEEAATGSGEFPELGILQFLFLFVFLFRLCVLSSWRPENNVFPCSSSLIEIQEVFG